MVFLSGVMVFVFFRSWKLFHGCDKDRAWLKSGQVREKGGTRKDKIFQWLHICRFPWGIVAIWRQSARDLAWQGFRLYFGAEKRFSGKPQRYLPETFSAVKLQLKYWTWIRAEKVLSFINGGVLRFMKRDRGLKTQETGGFGKVKALNCFILRGAVTRVFWSHCCSTKDIGNGTCEQEWVQARCLRLCHLQLARSDELILWAGQGKGG